MASLSTPRSPRSPALQLYASPDASALVILIANVALTHMGRAMRLVQEGLVAPAAASPALVNLVVRHGAGGRCSARVNSKSTKQAAQQGVLASYVTRVVRLAFLSSAVTDAILNGSVRNLRLGCK